MILLSYGTRPEFIKIKSLIEKLIENNIRIKTVFTGQHKDTFNKGMCNHVIDIVDEQNRLDAIEKSIRGNSHIFNAIDYVIVQGDTTSSLAMAQSAFNHGKKVIHIESGLRTFEETPYPEEMNRMIISRIAKIHFCPTIINQHNLITENCKGDIYVVGNTGIDALQGRDRNNGYNNQVIVTMHRRENHSLIREYFTIINDLATQNPELQFIIPLHPNPNVQKYKHLLSHLSVIESQDYEKMLDLISKCRFIITDSGGLQEEGSYFNKKVIVCRESTERPESLGIHTFLCKKPEELKDLFEKIKNNFEVNSECPFGDGKASDKIVQILLKNYIASGIQS